MNPSRDPTAQSIHDRLKARAAAHKEDFNSTLSRYGIERFLYRLSRSSHAEQFTLKGAMLFVLWLGRQHRATRDIDLLGPGELSAEAVRSVFDDVCHVQADADGLTFDPSSITVQEIRENQLLRARRVKVAGRLGSARISVTVDIGLGDTVTPTPVERDYPSMLDLPGARIKTYRPETAIAEKLQAMVQLGLRNSRMKDFFDIAILAGAFEFDGRVLADAVLATFENRSTTLDPNPICFTDAFAGDASKQVQWKAFIRRSRITDGPAAFGEAVGQVREFLQPLVLTLADGSLFDMRWPARGPWRPNA